MGSLFKQQFTKPIPTNAEVVRVKGRRCARWLNKRGKQQTALLNTEGTRIVRESKVYFARYRDGSGQVQTVSTECRDKQAAQSVLNELEKAAERIRAGDHDHCGSSNNGTSRNTLGGPCCRLHQAHGSDWMLSGASQECESSASLRD